MPGAGHAGAAKLLPAGVPEPVDDIVLFKPLNKDEIKHIIALLTDDLRKRLATRHISLDLSAAAVTSLLPPPTIGLWCPPTQTLPAAPTRDQIVAPLSPERSVMATR